MRSARIMSVFLLLASLSFAQSARNRQANPQLQQDMDAIAKLHDKDIQASMALDEAALESLWTDDIVTMHPGGPAVVGKAANVERLKAGIQEMRNQEILAYNAHFEEVRIVGDWAYEWGTISGRTRPFSGGGETAYDYNILRILQRQPDGSWKIARSIYNDAKPSAPQPEQKPQPKQEQRNKLED